MVDLLLVVISTHILPLPLPGKLILTPPRRILLMFKDSFCSCVGCILKPMRGPGASTASNARAASLQVIFGRAYSVALCAVLSVSLHTQLQIEDWTFTCYFHFLAKASSTNSAWRRKRWRNSCSHVWFPSNRSAWSQTREGPGVYHIGKEWCSLVESKR